MGLSPLAALSCSLSPGPGRWIELAEQLTVCGRLLRAAIGPLAGRQGLTDSQFSTLVVCRHAPPDGLGQTELAQILAVSPALVSTVVEGLRGRGLLQGRRAANDRRRQLWQLTPAGQSLLAGVAADLSDWAAAMDRRVASADLTNLHRMLEQLVALLHQAPAPATAQGPARQRRAG